MPEGQLLRITGLYAFLNARAPLMNLTIWRFSNSKAACEGGCDSPLSQISHLRIVRRRLLMIPASPLPSRRKLPGSGVFTGANLTKSIAVSISPLVVAALRNVKAPDVEAGVKLIVINEKAVEAGVNVPRFCAPYNTVIGLAGKPDRCAM